jgi:hypothetical protein
MQANISLTQQEARNVIRSHRGETARLARELDCTMAHVSKVLDGATKSRRVMDAAIQRASELRGGNHACQR